MGLLTDSKYGKAPDLRMRFVEEVGDAYLYGLAGGSAFHLFKGLRNSPNGGRLAGAALTIRRNVPRVAGSFAAFWGVWSVFECAMLGARRKEDPWNAIAAGAAAGGFLELRRGARATTRSTLAGAAIFTLLEGASIALDRVFAQLPPAGTPDDGPVIPSARRPSAMDTSPVAFLGIPPGPPIAVEELP